MIKHLMFVLFTATVTAYSGDAGKPEKQIPTETRITNVAPGIVRVQVVPKGKDFWQSPCTSIVPDLPAFNGRPIDSAPIDSAQGGQGRQTIKVIEKDGLITVSDGSGNKLVSQQSVIFSTATHENRKAKTTTTYPAVMVKWRSEQPDALFGLGSYQGGKLNLRGQTRHMRHENKEDSVPMFFSTAGFGILWDSPSVGSMTAAEKGDFSIHTPYSDLVDYYVITGKNPDEVIAGYRKLTGKAVMLPKWAFGYHQSRERYKTQAQVLEIANTFRRTKVPADVIVQDWQYWGKHGWNACKFDTDIFPDAKAMLKELHDLNLKCIISVWPSFASWSKGSPVYDELKKNNMLSTSRAFGGAQIYNAFDPKAREIVWKHTKQGLWDVGVDGWWLDAAEPEMGNVNWGTVKLPAPFQSIRNAYPAYVVQAFYEGQRKTAPDRRFFTLTRSAYAGSQRMGISYWTGDTGSHWGDLPLQVQACLGMSAAGIPYVNHDIGGFSTATRTPGFEELYLRWFQFGTFTPEMRSHGRGMSRAQWEFTELQNKRAELENNPMSWDGKGEIDLSNSESLGWLALGGVGPRERQWRFTTFSKDPKELYKPGRQGTEFREDVPENLKGWVKPGFDDSSWQKGFAPIGRGEWKTKDKTVVNRSQQGKGNVLLMRTTFELESLDQVAYRFLILNRESYHVYLNGHRVRSYRYGNGDNSYRLVPGRYDVASTKELEKHLKKGTNTLALMTYAKDVNAVDIFLQCQTKESYDQAAKKWFPEHDEAKENERTYNTLMTFTHLRYQLLPYIYSTAWKVYDEDYTMMRPLAMDFPKDPSIHNTKDKYMFGPALLVAPVLQPNGTQMVAIPAESLADAKKEPGGLDATYFSDETFKKKVLARKDPGVAFAWEMNKGGGLGADYFTDPIPELGKMDGFSARWEGYVKTRAAGTYSLGIMGNNSYRFFVDGKLVQEIGGRNKKLRVGSVRLDLPADTLVPVRVEYVHSKGQPKVTLAWMPPKALATADVALPKGANWYDFWTGEYHKGGKTYTKPTPLSSIPVFVRAGSILPFGPKLQYADEKTDKPCELRIYPGADAAFKLYNDTGDGYGYEKGEHAIVPLSWNDATSTLTIGARQGSYPGMAKTDVFLVRLLQKDGSWKEISVTYTGKQEVCRF